MKTILLNIAVVFILTSITEAQIAGTAGAFSRLGSGARGMGIGNALTAVNSGDVSSYYNPALSAFSEQRTATATFSILAFERYLNFLNYTMPLKPQAGISIGIINAGVRNIDGRDGDGVHTEDYSTNENQFYLSFSNRVDPSVSIGVTVKLFHSKLFDEVKSTTVGFDAGLCAQLTDQLSMGIAVIDLNSKYKWDTKSIYGENGRPTEDKFPNIRKLALAYRLPEHNGLVSVEFENSSQKSNLVRAGAEYSPVNNFTLRAGIDRLEFGDDATGAKPSFGFSVANPLDGWSPAIHYSFVVESYASHGMHIISLSTSF